MTDEPELPEDSGDEMPAQGAVLFNSERALAARNAGIQNAREETEFRRAQIIERIAISTELVTAYDSAYPTADKLAKLYKAGAARIAHDVLTGRIEVKSAGQAAQLLTALSTAGRLEAGEVTSSHETVSPEQRLERMQELRAALDQQQAEAEKAQEAGQVVPLTS